ncbi:MAG TPA: hypothetical protein VGJ29_04805 [Vicinamibacterales bacterium]|jgi:Tfp pilus assembly protein FimT
MVLIELIFTLAVAAIVAAFGFVRLASITDAATTNEATQRVVTLLDAARGAAVRLDGVAIVALSDSVYAVRVVQGTDTIAAWNETGSHRDGITLSGVGAPIRFGPAGIAVGAANRTLVIGKGSAQRRIVLSRLGRLEY